MDTKENGGGEVIKSEDPGETLEEAGIAGEDTESTGDDDGAETSTDTETDDAKPDEAGDESNDGSGEGAEADGAGEKDDGKSGLEEKEPTTVEAAFELLKQKEAEIARLKGETKSAEAGPAPKQMTDEDWAVLENRFGGLSRSQIEPIAEFMDRASKSVEDRIVSRIAKIEKELTINAMAEQDGTRDVRSYRKEMEEYLGNFDQRSHADPKLLKMAYIYARGLKAPEAVKRAVASKERGLKVIGVGKPNTGGGSAGGKGSGVKLTPQERAVAKAAGMSEAEYAKWKR